MADQAWKLQVFRTGSVFRWKLVNRDGDLVMTSRDWYSTRVGARRAAEYEQTTLRSVEVSGG